MSLPPPPIKPVTEALFKAIRANDLKGIDAALAAGADINGEETYDFAIDRDRYQGSRTPLMLAVDLQNVAMARRLLAVRGIEVDRGDCFAGKTALMAAAEEGSTELVELLLAAGADPNREEKYELRTAAAYAICGRQPEIAMRLIEAGTDLRLYGSKLWTYATNFDYPQIIELMKARGLGVRRFEHARAREEQERRRWAAMEIPEQPPAMISDDELFRACREGDIRLLRQAAAFGVRLDRQRADGRTPLMAATEHGQSQAAMILIEAGADLRLTDGAGKDALALAEELKQTHIAAALRRRLRRSTN